MRAETGIRAVATALALPVSGTRDVARFDHDNEVQTSLGRERGGKAAVNREVSRQGVALFSWGVRFFTPGDPREVRVTLAPDGRVLGFARQIVESGQRPTLDSAVAVAGSVRDA